MSGPKVVLVVGGSESVTTVLSALGLGAVWDDGAVALWVPAGSERARLEATGQLRCSRVPRPAQTSGKPVNRARPTQPTPPGPSGALLDYEAAAAYLRTTPRQLRELWARRRITAVKVGRSVRFAPADLDAFVAANRVPAVERGR